MAKPASTGWLIVCLGDKATGDGNWTSTLDHPESWCPGVVAVPVDDADDYYVAIGGNDYGGAEQWVCIDTRLAEV
ncbi:MAG: hypothetical protein AAFX93_18720 [Verrucomicrobiota bacterium]